MITENPTPTPPFNHQYQHHPSNRGRGRSSAPYPRNAQYNPRFDQPHSNSNFSSHSNPRYRNRGAVSRRIVIIIIGIIHMKSLRMKKLGQPTSITRIFLLFLTNLFGVYHHHLPQLAPLLLPRYRRQIRPTPNRPPPGAVAQPPTPRPSSPVRGKWPFHSV